MPFLNKILRGKGNYRAILRIQEKTQQKIQLETVMHFWEWKPQTFLIHSIFDVSFTVYWGSSIQFNGKYCKAQETKQMSFVEVVYVNLMPLYSQQTTKQCWFNYVVSVVHTVDICCLMLINLVN